MATIVLKWGYNHHFLSHNNPSLKNALDVSVLGAELNRNGYTWIVRQAKGTQLSVKIEPLAQLERGNLHAVVAIAFERDNLYKCFKPDGTFKEISGAEVADIQDFWVGESPDCLQIKPILLDQPMSIKVQLLFTPPTGLPVLTGLTQLLIYVL